MVEGLLPFVVAAADARTPLAADGIDLIDENDAGRLGLGLTEQIPHPTGTHPHEHLHEFGGGHREEGHSGLASDGLGEQGLAGTWRTHQQHTLGNLGADRGEPLRRAQEGDHLLELLLGLGDPGHILETHPHRTLGLKTGLAAAEAEGPVRHLARTADQQGEASEEQHHQ